MFGYMYIDTVGGPGRPGRFGRAGNCAGFECRARPGVVGFNQCAAPPPLLVICYAVKNPFNVF